MGPKPLIMNNNAMDYNELQMIKKTKQVKGLGSQLSGLLCLTIYKVLRYSQANLMHAT